MFVRERAVVVDVGPAARAAVSSTRGESGNVDYLGKDSWENIQKMLDESLEKVEKKHRGRSMCELKLKLGHTTHSPISNQFTVVRLNSFINEHLAASIVLQTLIRMKRTRRSNSSTSTYRLGFGHCPSRRWGCRAAIVRPLARDKQWNQNIQQIKPIFSSIPA